MPYTPVQAPQVVVRSFRVASMPEVALRTDVPESDSQQLVSLILSSDGTFKKEGVNVIFQPWRDYLDFVRQTPSFPFSFALLPDSLINKRVIERPLVNFTGWAPQGDTDIYMDHPHPAHRGSYVVYWALMVLVNACQASLEGYLESAVTSGSSDVSRRLWRFLASTPAKCSR